MSQQLTIEDQLEVEAAVRELSDYASKTFPEEFRKLSTEIHHAERLQDIQALYQDVIAPRYSSIFGPLIKYRVPTARTLIEEPVIVVTDLDCNGNDSVGIDLSDDYEDSITEAAKSYRQECGWDLPPACDGVWVLHLTPYYGSGTEDGPWNYRANLTGFAVLQDRDKDGKYESMAHIWVAFSSRKKGIGSQIISKLRSMGVTKIEYPYTYLGGHLLKKSWPEMLAPMVER